MSGVWTFPGQTIFGGKVGESGAFRSETPNALAVILDMDGLMLDTEPLSLQAWQEAAAELGYQLTDGLLRQTIGLNAKATTQLLERRFGNDFPSALLASQAVMRYRATLDRSGVPRKAGLLEFLCYLDERRIPRAVATSTSTELATKNLRQAGVLDRVDVVVGGEQVELGKPAPEIFLAAARRLDHAPADCVVLEDSEPGLRASVAAGMTPILIPDLLAPSPEARELAHSVVESLLEARAVIDSLVAT